MSLIFLSDMTGLNASLLDRVSGELANRGGRIAYTSSAPQDANRAFFEATQREYASILPSAELTYFDLSNAFTSDDLAQIPSFHAVHLSGGNTYAFLQASRERGLKSLLTRHVGGSGLIIGVSAGAILMTPDIGTGDFCGDRNLSDVRDTVGLSLVEFLFLPHLGKHFAPTVPNVLALKQYANRVGREVYASKDGDGIFVDDVGGITVYGDPLVLPA